MSPTNLIDTLRLTASRQSGEVSYKDNFNNRTEGTNLSSEGTLKEIINTSRRIFINSPYYNNV